MNIDKLIEKDIQKEVNPFAYTRLQTRMKENAKRRKFSLEYSLQLVSLLLVFAFSMNIFSQINVNEEKVSEKMSFEQFAEENCFDILLNYNPTILFE